MKEVLYAESLQDQEALRVSQFVEEVYSSNGDKIIPLIGDALGILHIKTERFQNNSEIHYLTLLRNGNDDKELLPIGWLGFETSKENKIAKFSWDNMSQFCHLDLKHTNVVADKPKKIIYLPKIGNKYFFADYTKDEIFSYLGFICVAVKSDYQDSGFGSLLVQLAGNLAQINGMEIFKADHNLAMDCAGGQFQERSFGLKKIVLDTENEKSWYFDIKNNKLPIWAIKNYLK